MHDLNDTHPPSPFIGVRSYEVEDAILFHGRDADVAAVANLVADKARWRLILLHGMTGSGKSSFLKAGLMPLVTSDEIDTRVFHRADDARQTLFISAGFDPLMRLAEAAAELIGQPEWWRHPEAPKPWDAAEVRAAGACATALADVFEAMAPLLRKPLLLIVDQAEEVFTLARQADGGPAGERFFDFLAAFCRRPNWIQVLISMRTEFFGRYDQALRQRLGAEMPVAPYLLASPSAAMLEEVMRGPCGLVFADTAGRDYRVRLEDGIERRLAEELVQSFPGPGALTAMQVVGLRLVKEGLEGAAVGGVPDPGQPLKVRLTPSMLAEIGPMEDVIEDLIDEAIGNFCEREGLVLGEALALWTRCTITLGQLVAPQAEGAPVTRFLPREQFMTALSEPPRVFDVPWKRRAADYWPGIFTRLVDFLEERNVRVLRSVKAYFHGGAEPTVFLALGHDIIAVGIWRVITRDIRRRQGFRRFLFLLLASTGFLATLSIGVTVATIWIGESVGWWHRVSLDNLMASVFLSGLVVMFAALTYAAWRISELRGYLSWLFVLQNKLIGAPSRRWRSFETLLKPFAQTARVLHFLKAEQRQKFPESNSVQAFPGAARF